MTRRPDDGVVAFRVAAATAVMSVLLVAGVSVALEPLGAIAHLRGMVHELCVTTSHITSDIASLALIALSVSALLAGCLSLVASLRVHRQSLGMWMPTPATDVAARRAADAVERAGITSATVVFRDDAPIACCRGIRAPSIWISDAAIELLDDDELAAVLAHEDHHCTRRDPAKRQLLEILSRACFAFPIVADATAAYRRAAEFAADDAASRATSRTSTAKALLRFALTPQVPATVQFGAELTIAERVQRLLGARRDASRASRRACAVSAATATVSLLCVVAIALLPTM